MNVQEMDTELAQRAARIEDMGGVRDANGLYRVESGWDANEVVGRDGLATQADGNVALWLNGEPAWHKLGTVAEGWTTTRDALVGGGLFWTVEKRPTFFGQYEDSVYGGSKVNTGQMWATVRVDPDGMQTQLGTVGHIYTPFQNEAAFAFLEGITEQNAGHFVSAGMLARGSTVFVVMELGEDIVIDAAGANDHVKRYVTFTNRHDGKGKITTHTSPVRTVCANTMDWSLENAMTSWSTSHTSQAESRVEDARRELKLTSKYFEKFAADATNLYETSMSQRAFDAFLKDVVFPLTGDETDRIQRETLEKRDAVQALWASAPTVASVKGTRWGAANAVTEWMDHQSPVRVAKSLRLDEATPRSIQEEMARGARLVGGADADEKSRIHKALLTWSRR